METPSVYSFLNGPAQPNPLTLSPHLSNSLRRAGPTALAQPMLPLSLLHPLLHPAMGPHHDPAHSIFPFLSPSSFPLGPPSAQAAREA